MSKHNLLSSADEHRRKEAKGHPDFIQTRLVICDVPEGKGGVVNKHLHVCPVRNIWALLSPEPGVYKALQNQLEHLQTREVRNHPMLTSGSLTWTKMTRRKYLCHRNVHFGMDLQVQPRLVVFEEQSRPGIHRWNIYVMCHHRFKVDQFHRKTTTDS